MTDITKHSFIKPESLDTADYFSSLLTQASQLGILSESDAEALQADCLALLSRIVRRFAGIDSSSVRIDTAQELLSSVLFTLGVALKSLPTPDDALAFLLDGSVSGAYARGRTEINRLLSQSKRLHNALMANLFLSPNEFYSATVIGGIGGFFKLYRPDYFANEIHITADYPLLSPRPALLGIEFIFDYLQCLSLENTFLSVFDRSAVHRLLLCYDRHYAALPINLCEPVLFEALGCVLAKEPPRSLSLSPDGLNALSELFCASDKAQILSRLNDTLTTLSASLGLSDSLRAYLRGALPSLAARAENAAAHDALSQIFTVV